MDNCLWAARSARDRVPTQTKFVQILAQPVRIVDHRALGTGFVEERSTGLGKRARASAHLDHGLQLQLIEVVDLRDLRVGQTLHQLHWPIVAQCLRSRVTARVLPQPLQAVDFDLHLADQWALALAVHRTGVAARYTCTQLTLHARTNFELIEKFLPGRFDTGALEDGYLVQVRPA